MDPQIANSQEHCHHLKTVPDKIHYLRGRLIIVCLIQVQLEQRREEFWKNLQGTGKDSPSEREEFLITSLREYTIALEKSVNTISKEMVSFKGTLDVIRKKELGKEINTISIDLGSFKRTLGVIRKKDASAWWSSS